MPAPDLEDEAARKASRGGRVAREALGQKGNPAKSNGNKKPSEQLLVKVKDPKTGGFHFFVLLKPSSLLAFHRKVRWIRRGFAKTPTPVLILQEGINLNEEPSTCDGVPTRKQCALVQSESTF